MASRTRCSVSPFKLSPKVHRRRFYVINHSTICTFNSHFYTSPFKYCGAGKLDVTRPHEEEGVKKLNLIILYQDPEPLVEIFQVGAPLARVLDSVSVADYLT
ncbi:hypothetical protein LCGC14_1949630 [marine sediment metagenome]|uniref:Uncharacterized protein n=1 Tax=marine sediment metagenome TaxID=412755 RepID=A0A0F9FHR9_9ZZZZ